MLQRSNAFSPDPAAWLDRPELQLVTLTAGPTCSLPAQRHGCRGGRRHERGAGSATASEMLSRTSSDLRRGLSRAVGLARRCPPPACARNQRCGSTGGPFTSRRGQLVACANQHRP